MRWKKVVYVFAGIVLLCASRVSAQQVKNDYDRDANFSQYKTYSWEQVKTKNPLNLDRIKSAVNAALTAKGWSQVNSGGDVSIVAMEITHEQQRSLREALAANLDDANRTIVTKIVQAVIDLRDAADAFTSTGDALTKERQALWNARAQDFGNQMEALRDRSPFYNQKIQ